MKKAHSMISFFTDINMYPLEVLVANEMDGLSLFCRSSEYIYVPINGTSFNEPYCPMTNGIDYLKTVRDIMIPILTQSLTTFSCFLQIDFNKDNMLRDSLVFLGFYFVFLLLIVLLIKFVKHQKR